MKPRPLDQIHEATGVSADYYNHIMTMVTALRGRGTDWFIERTRTRPLLRYEEAYPISAYSDVVSEKNRDRVARINALVDETNAAAKSGALTLQNILDTHNQLLTLIAGKHDWPARVEEIPAYD